MVELVTVSVPRSCRCRRRWLPAELLAMVELVTVSVPSCIVDAAAVAGARAELLAMVELVTVSVPPALSMPPPS